MVNVKIIPIDRDLDVWLKWRLRCHIAFAYICLCFELWCRTMYSCVWERQYTLCRLFIFKCHWIFYVNSWETILSSSAVPLVLFSRCGNVEPTKSYLWIGSFVSDLTTLYKRLKLFNVELYERMILSCEMARKGGGRILWFVRYGPDKCSKLRKIATGFGGDNRTIVRDSNRTFSSTGGPR